MIIGYLDASDRNISADEQRDIVTQYALSNASTIDVFFNEKNIQDITNSVNSQNNTIIISNIVCLGNKLSLIVKNIETLTSKGFTLVSIKENLKFDNSKQTAQLLQGIKLSIDIRNSMVSTITTKALSNRKSNGHILGRQEGSKNKTHLCDNKYTEIKSSISNGLTKTDIAKSIGVSIATLYNFLREHPELKISEIGGREIKSVFKGK